MPSILRQTSCHFRLLKRNIVKVKVEKYGYPDVATFAEKKITKLFLNTLQESYYDRLLPSAMRNFADMIMAGNLVDHAIKNDKKKGRWK